MLEKDHKVFEGILDTFFFSLKAFIFSIFKVCACVHEWRYPQNPKGVLIPLDLEF